MTTTLYKALLGSVIGTAILAAALGFNPVSAFAQEEEGIASFASKEEPLAFDTPEAAVDAFKKALADNDIDRLSRILGLDPAKIRANDDTMNSYEQIREGAAKLVVVEDEGDRKIVEIGEKLWPLPFPIAKGDDDKWFFDTFTGFEEIINRRVGENELEAIDTMRAYVDAQNDYADADHDADGVNEYAQLLISSEGQQDGLYWEGEGSPAGDFVDQAALDKAKAGDGYFGYRYKILKGQGDNVAGGAYDYVINGNMIAGFGLIAWPVKYAETGVNTFMVNQHGIVYEADLGPATEEIVKYIDRFNPGDNWSIAGD
ncbi:DUF2950 family protein [Stappia sp. F7233]|uniref:DUF2950 family protein n=1 Tax=Stappia albiluteola TaxID=2758565 RepID=A0A839AEL3_9HYPH|nr:DUF2950 family protein [Stappia albiluteola]MBA5777566.1 DUF2950 family protein [Stappia albiluteola]